MAKITDFSDVARYNIKAVSRRTGVQPVTLRAWERRYQILNPTRAENGYRLYSEQEMVMLAWLKTQVDSGISISSAAAELKQKMNDGIWLDAIAITPAPALSKKTGLPPSDIVKKLFNALTSHDEPTASSIFEEALASFPLPKLFGSVVGPVLVEIGEAWFHGRILVATEHFASAFMRAKLMAIFQSMPGFRPLDYIMIGSPTGELHEIGSLMMSILLREAGYRVEYLGPDLPLDDLVLYAKDERPKMVILSATIKESITSLAGFDEMLKAIRPKPLFGFGGPAFNLNPELIKSTPGIFLGDTLSASIQTVQDRLAVKKW